MKGYLSIANERVFFVCAGIVIIFVMLQAIIFGKLAFDEGKKIGLSKKRMFKAFRTGAVSSGIPTIAIIMALITMLPTLGIPIPWMRLSVIGSAPYELMAAGIGAKSMGINSLGGEGYTVQTFAASVWIMCVGSFWAVGIVALFLKKIQNNYSKTLNRDEEWNKILASAAFLGVFCTFIADPVTKGGLPLVTLLSGAIIMTILALIITKFKIEWLKEFALTVSMLGAMLCAICFSNFIY